MGSGLWHRHIDTLTRRWRWGPKETVEPGEILEQGRSVHKADKEKGLCFPQKTTKIGHMKI